MSERMVFSLATKIASALKAQGRAGDWMAICPAHREKTASLHISERDGAVLLHCFGGCDQTAVIDALRERGLWHDGPVAPSLIVKAKPMTDEMTAAERERVAGCQRVWDQAVSAEGTLAQLYLQCRGIVSDVTPLPPSLRFVAENNVLIAAVTRPDSDELVGLHAVYLTEDEAGVWKDRRLSYGPVRFGSIKLSAPDTRMQITESLEDGLALMQMNGVAALAVPGTSMFSRVVPPNPCRTVVLAPDRDEAGEKAVTAASAHLHDLGYAVRVLLPPVDAPDWCDFLPLFEERQAIIREPFYG